MIAPNLLLTNEKCLYRLSDIISKFLADTGLLEYSTHGKVTNVIFPSEGMTGDTYDMFRVVKEFSDKDREVMYTSMVLHWMFNISKFDRFSWGYYINNENEIKPLPLIFRGLAMRDTKQYHMFHIAADPATIHCFLNDPVYDAVLRKILKAAQEWLENYRNYYLCMSIDKIADFLQILDDHTNFLECVLKTARVVSSPA